MRVTVLRGQDPTYLQRVIVASFEVDLDDLRERLQRGEDTCVVLREGGREHRYRVVGICYSRRAPAIEVEPV